MAKDDGSYSVIIVKYNFQDFTLSLDSILENTDQEIVVIDNWNRASYLSYRVKTISGFGNIGWTKACNAGIALTSKPFIILCNEDILVKDSLDLLIEPMLQDDKIALVGPITEGPCNQGRLGDRRNFQPNITLDGFGIGSFPLSFFCVAIRREALLSVGGYLDDNFNTIEGESYGGDDDDLQARLSLAGWKSVVTPEVFVVHNRRDYHRNNSGNVEKLRKKWKKILEQQETIFKYQSLLT